MSDKARAEEGKKFRFLLAVGVEPRCWHEPDYSWQEAEGAPLQGKII